MPINTYKVTEDHDLTSVKKGEIVFDCHKNTYGCLSEDEHALGVPCASVTRNSEGDYPFLIVPQHKLKQIN